MSTGIHVDGGRKLYVPYEAFVFVTTCTVCDIYQVTRVLGTGAGATRYAGCDGPGFVLVMDMLGPNLADLRRICRGAFTLRTVCMPALQMDRVLHSRGVVCCDIKPSNSAMGNGEDANVVHLFDIGLAKTFLHPAAGKHIALRQSRHTLGTPRCTPRNHTHLAQQVHDADTVGLAGVSRRDDIESLLYVLLEFYHGTLPWKGLPRPPPGVRGVPCPLLQLPYGKAPDYTPLRTLFRDRMRGEGWECDSSFEWMNGAALKAGTLLPEEYVYDLEAVLDKEWNPRYM
ncbi:kinase-like domain-containing protein [Trametes elegans]|nr:kinase-like domain-containing protein [Trametes elegans]